VRNRTRKRGIYQGIRKRIPAPTRVERDRREQLREKEDEKEMGEESASRRDREQNGEAER
jgi:hypothetical protein